MPGIVTQITNGANDGYNTGGAWSVTGDGSNYIWLGEWGGAAENGGWAFTLNVPQGAVIVRAHLILNALDSHTPTPNLIIRAHDVDNFPGWTSSLRPDNITPTTAYATWSPNPSNFTWYNTPDISTVIQEIISRAGWVSGNNIGIAIINNATGGDYDTTWADYSWDAGSAGKLFVEYYVDTEPQRASPVSTYASSNFTTTAYTSVDENIPDDSDFVTSLNTANGYITFKVASLSDPGSHVNHQVQARIRQADKSNVRTYQLALYQGTTLISTGAAVNCYRYGFVYCFLNVSEAEAANITDYTDLYVRINTGGNVGTPAPNRATVIISWVRLEVPGTSGGTLYYQTAAGAFTPVGVPVKATDVFYTGSLSPAGVSIRSISKIVSGLFSPIGTLTRILSTFIVGVVSPGGITTKGSSKLTSGDLTPAGSFSASKFVSQIVEGILSFVGSLAHKPQKIAGGSLTPESDITKHITSQASGDLTPAGSFSVIKFIAQVVEGILSFVGSLAHKPQKITSGNLTPESEISRKVGKPTAGELPSIGGLTATRLIQWAVLGVVSFSGSLANKARPYLTGEISLSGIIAKKTSALISGASSFVGETYKSISIFVVGSITPDGAASVRQVITQAIAGVLAPVGTLARRSKVFYLGELVPIGQNIKQVSKRLVGSLGAGSTLSAIRRFTSMLWGVIAPSGGVVNKIQVYFEGTFTPSGVIIRLIKLSALGIVQISGGLAAIFGNVRATIEVIISGIKNLANNLIGTQVYEATLTGIYNLETSFVGLQVFETELIGVYNCETQWSGRLS